MLKSFIATCFTLFVISTPVMAQEMTPTCAEGHPSLAESIAVGESMAKESPEVTFRRIGPNAAQKIMDVLNDVEPKTEYKTDTILLLIPMDKDVPLRMAFSYEGCLAGAFNIPQDKWYDIVKKAIGSDL